MILEKSQILPGVGVRSLGLFGLRLNMLEWYP